MNVTKKNIIKNINKESSISIKDGSILLESFLMFVKKQAKLNNKVKLSGFGTFSLKKTLNRVGRNPKTGNSYIIPTQKKVNFKTSNILKDKINL